MSNSKLYTGDTHTTSSISNILTVSIAQTNITRDECDCGLSESNVKCLQAQPVPADVKVSDWQSGNIGRDAGDTFCCLPITTDTCPPPPKKFCPQKKSPIRKSPSSKGPIRKSPSRKGPMRKSPSRKGPMRKSPTNRCCTPNNCCPSWPPIPPRECVPCFSLPPTTSACKIAPPTTVPYSISKPPSSDWIITPRSPRSCSPRLKSPCCPAEKLKCSLPPQQPVFFLPRKVATKPKPFFFHTEKRYVDRLLNPCCHVPTECMPCPCQEAPPPCCDPPVCPKPEVFYLPRKVITRPREFCFQTERRAILRKACAPAVCCECAPQCPPPCPPPLARPKAARRICIDDEDCCCDECCPPPPCPCHARTLPPCPCPTCPPSLPVPKRAPKYWAEPVRRSSDQSEPDGPEPDGPAFNGNPLPYGPNTDRILGEADCEVCEVCEDCEAEQEKKAKLMKKFKLCQTELERTRMEMWKDAERKAIFDEKIAMDRMEQQYKSQIHEWELAQQKSEKDRQRRKAIFKYVLQKVREKKRAKEEAEKWRLYHKKMSQQENERLAATMRETEETRYYDGMKMLLEQEDKLLDAQMERRSTVDMKNPELEELRRLFAPVNRGPNEIFEYYTLEPRPTGAEMAREAEENAKAMLGLRNQNGIHLNMGDRFKKRTTIQLAMGPRMLEGEREQTLKIVTEPGATSAEATKKASMRDITIPDNLKPFLQTLPYRVKQMESPLMRLKTFGPGPNFDGARLFGTIVIPKGNSIKPYYTDPYCVTF